MPPRKVTNTRRRDTAYEKLTDLSDERNRAEEQADKKRHKMYSGMLKAFNAGLTYDEIAEITQLSKIRVSQVLADQRNGE